MRASGSSGGHKGLQDVIDRLGTEEFCRLRVGIDAGPGSTSEYVLSRFEAVERPAVERAVAGAADGVESWIARGVERTMSAINADPPSTAGSDQA